MFLSHASRGFLRRVGFAGLLLALALVVPQSVTASRAAVPGKVAVVRPGGLPGPGISIPGADQASDRELMVERLAERWASVVRVREQLGPHPLSRKGLARRDRRVLRLLRAPGVIQPDTLRVLLVRIAFDSDRSGTLTSITEDGNFLLEPDPAILFDPPPHDLNYFQAHAEALAEYWSSMSNGQIVAETTVIPPGDQDAYRLSDIADYGPGSGGFWTIELLEKLVQDMIIAADEGSLADGSAKLADFDFDDPETHIIFAHAGADLQSNLVWEPGRAGYSPNDIPTFFVTLGDSARVDLSSIDSSTGEPGQVTECSVIPETISQDGLVGAISAALAHEFGHALGLPDLYSTTTGLPTVGYWGIMDSGTNLASAVAVPDPDNPGELKAEFVTGLLPPQPTLWSKWYLGLVDEVRVGGNESTHELPASWRQDRRDKALRIDVSPNEFFLVENRWVPLALDPSWSLTADPQSGVVLYLGEYEEPTPGQFKLIGNTNLYDFFMPYAGGLMIWRVRQDRVEAGMPTNTVQVSSSRLGVELIEADGIKDLGVADFATRGFLGSDSDAFRSAGSYVYGDATIDVPATSTELGPDTLPSSESSFRIPTGVTISGIGPASDNTMTLTTRVDGMLQGPATGFPVDLPADEAASILRGAARSAGAMQIAGRTAVIVGAQDVDESSPAGIYAYDRDGEPFFGAARAADLAGLPVGGLLLADGADLPATPDASLISVAATGQVEVFGPGSSGLNRLLSVSMGSVDTQPVLVRTPSRPFLVAASRADASLHSVELSDATPLASTWNAAGEDKLMADPVFYVGLDSSATSTEGVAIMVGNTIDFRDARLRRPDRDRWPVNLPSGFEADSLAWLASLPQEGGADRIVVASDRGEVAVVMQETAGSRVELLPIQLDGSPVGEVVLADADSDGELDLVIATADRLWALHRSGAPLRGFPVKLSELLIVLDREDDRFVGAPVVADLDRDGENEIAITTYFGVTHVLSGRGASEPGFPRAFSGSGSTLGIVDFAGTAGTTRALLAFDALGDSLGSGRRARPPRIAALDLGAAPDGAAMDRPAEWNWPGGSMSRAGRGGVGAAAAGGVNLAEGLATAMIIPNPIGRGENRAFVRYFSGAAHTATITVYTLEGEVVGRWEHEVPDGGVPVQLEWSAEGLVSGPYLCRVDYVGRDGKTSDLKTVYVER